MEEDRKQMSAVVEMERELRKRQGKTRASRQSDCSRTRICRFPRSRRRSTCQRKGLEAGAQALQKAKIAAPQKAFGQLRGDKPGPATRRRHALHGAASSGRRNPPRGARAVDSSDSSSKGDEMGSALPLDRYIIEGEDMETQGARLGRS